MKNMLNKRHIILIVLIFLFVFSNLVLAGNDLNIDVNIEDNKIVLDESALLNGPGSGFNTVYNFTAVVHVSGISGDWRLSVKKMNNSNNHNTNSFAGDIFVKNPNKSDIEWNYDTEWVKIDNSNKEILCSIGDKSFTLKLQLRNLSGIISPVDYIWPIRFKVNGGGN